MSEYYAVQRSGNELRHYGVRGMKWGVRKAIMQGSDRALGRQYKKAAKKLAKLEKRANNGRKYAKRAAALGAGAAAAGGLAALGTGGVSRIVSGAGQLASKSVKSAGAFLSKVPGNSRASRAIRRAGTAAYNVHGTVGTATGKAGRAISEWGNRTDVGRTIGRGVANTGRAAGNASLRIGNNAAKKVASGASRSVRETGKAISRSGVSNNTLARIGAGAVGAGLLGAAGYNAYRAASTKRAARKAAAFRAEMNRTFAGTQYAGKPRQGRKRRK